MKQGLNKLGIYMGVALLLLVLAACGAKQTNEQIVDDKDNKVEAQEKKQEQEKEQVQEQEQEAEAEATRIYTDALSREVEIPKHPKRVVALWSVGDMLLLDTKPIGSTTHLLRFYSDEEKQDIEMVGEDVMGDHERILALNPDVIIVYARATEEEIEQYQKIAPTVATSFFGDPFEALQAMGDILGKQEQADQWIENYNKRVEEVGKSLSALNVEGDKALVLLLSGKNMHLFPSNIFPTIFDVYNFKLTDTQRELEKDGPFNTQQLSIEGLLEFADADRIFVVVNDEASRSVFTELQESNVWNSLPAVAKKQVYELGNRISTRDVSTFEWALDEVRLLLEGEKK